MKSLIVAPHPDDEVLGAGGTLLRRKAEGGITAWLIVTEMTEAGGWGKTDVERREQEIGKIRGHFAFDEVFNLRLPSAMLDTLPVGDIVRKISQVISSYGPEEIFVPNLGDVHSDHGVVFRAVASCTKAFRQPSIKRILSYEVLSETDFGLERASAFVPNVFVDISAFLEAKVKAMELYSSETGVFPFPRSREAIEALARVRGAAAGFGAAEAFQLLRERS
jgi:LmbE family N-acetylglucosaminyl deacetylase